MLPANLSKESLLTSPRKETPNQARQDAIEPSPTSLCCLPYSSYRSSSNHLPRVPRVFRLVRTFRSVPFQTVSCKTRLASSEGAFFSYMSYRCLLGLLSLPIIWKTDLDSILEQTPLHRLLLRQQPLYRRHPVRLHARRVRGLQ